MSISSVRNLLRFRLRLIIKNVIGDEMFLRRLTVDVVERQDDADESVIKKIKVNLESLVGRLKGCDGKLSAKNFVSFSCGMFRISKYIKNHHHEDSSKTCLSDFRKFSPLSGGSGGNLKLS